MLILDEQPLPTTRLLGVSWVILLKELSQTSCFDQKGTSCCILMSCLSLFPIAETNASLHLPKMSALLRHVFGDSYKTFRLKSVWTELNCTEPLTLIWTESPYLPLTECFPPGLATWSATAERGFGAAKISQNNSHLLHESS